MSMAEARRRGWDEIDVVFVTGDAYVDHPSLRWQFLVGTGSRRISGWASSVNPIGTIVTIGGGLADRDCFRDQCGNMDMINHYTAGRKVRMTMLTVPAGRSGTRPDRSTLSYCHRA
ncbi:MAG: hypothetical protein R3C05_24505 [Pirellulaceae bacterium]